MICFYKKPVLNGAGRKDPSCFTAFIISPCQVPVRFQSLQTYIVHTYKHKNANMHKCTLEMTFEHQCGQVFANPTRVVHYYNCYTPNRAIRTYMYLVAISVLLLQPVPHAMDACTYVTVGSLLLLTVTCMWNWLEWKNTNIYHIC